MAEVNLKKFDMSKLKSDAIILLLAKRRTGKSYLCRDIMFHKRDIPSGLVVSPTEKASPWYANFIPDLFIHDSYTDELLAKFLKRQRTIREVGKTKNIDERGFLVMDDCMFDSKWTKSTEIRNIFFNGRHYGVFYILLMQYALGIPPALRSNIDYVFILKENVFANRKKLYDNYAGVFPSFEAFCRALDKCTEDYECLVIDNTVQSNKIDDIVFWYKASSHEDFKVGSYKFWKYANKNYDPSYETRSGKMNMNPNELSKKDKKNMIINKIN